MKIGLVGWNGMMNVGDDAMTAVIIRKLNYLFGNELEFHFYNSVNKKMPFYIDKSRKLEFKGLPLYDRINKIKGVRKFFADYYYPLKFKQSKDLILIGGGSIVHSSTSSASKLKMVKAARKANPNITIGAIGISIGPFKVENDFYAAKTFLSYLDFVVVRDSRSLKVLQSMKLNLNQTMAPDLAFSLPKLANLTVSKVSRKTKVLGISLRTGHLTEERYSRYLHIIKYWLSLSSTNQVTLFNFSELPSQNDHRNSEILMNLIEDSSLKDRVDIFRYSLDPLDFYKKIMNCELMVCMRLHAAIIGYAVKTPVLIDSYHQKCKDLAKELDIIPSLIGKDGLTEIEDKIKEIYHIKSAASKFNFIKYDQIIKDSSDHFRFLDNTVN